MIHFFIGTKAQFIKMAPIMLEMQKRRIKYRYIDSGQHAELTKKLQYLFGLPDPDFFLRQETDNISSIIKALKWYAYCFSKSVINKKWLINEVFPEGGICLIHGDTLSTLLGMQMAYKAGLKIVHVEAGLRSFKFFDPFPEEIIRIICMRFAHLLYAPSQEAFLNLSNMNLPGEAIKLNGNTVVDSLRHIKNISNKNIIPKKPFILSTCHRLENIKHRNRLSKIISLFNKFAEHHSIVFVMHEPTRKQLQQFGLDKFFHNNILIMDMLQYNDFTTLMIEAKMVLTDGGSIQEECAYLNKPCLVLRSATERNDGIGINAVLWKFDEKIADSFLCDFDQIKPGSETITMQSPSKMIVDTLIKKGYTL